MALFCCAEFVNITRKRISSRYCTPLCKTRFPTTQNNLWISLPFLFFNNPFCMFFNLSPSFSLRFFSFFHKLLLVARCRRMPVAFVA